MTKINQLIEQKIERYESHLKHIDELFIQAEKEKNKKPEHTEIHAQIANLKDERDKFAQHIDGLKQGYNTDFEENMIEKSGPMGIWDVLAQQLEKLVEHLTKT